MKLFAGSDYHLEFWKPDHMRVVSHGIPSDLDVLVVPGDLAAFPSFTDDEIKEIFAALKEKAKHVLFVPGNHEFYGGAVSNWEKFVREQVGSWVTVLEAEKVVEIEGRRFLGCTGW